MIHSIMLVTLGFLIAILFTIVFSSALWARAVRLTTERIKANMPITFAEMQADKDQLRAEFAVKIRQYEIKLENANLKTARQLIELSRRETELTKLEVETNRIHGELEEERNANSVLKQTISTRIPQMEAQLLKAKEMLGVRYQEITRLRSTINQKEGEIGEIRSAEQQRAAEIQRLKNTLETQDTSSKSMLEEYDQLKSNDTVLREEIARLKKQLKDANYASEHGAQSLREEMHRLSDQIVALSTKSSDTLPSKTPATQASEKTSVKTQEQATEGPKTKKDKNDKDKKDDVTALDIIAKTTEIADAKQTSSPKDAKASKPKKIKSDSVKAHPKQSENSASQKTDTASAEDVHSENKAKPKNGKAEGLSEDAMPELEKMFDLKDKLEKEKNRSKSDSSSSLVDQVELAKKLGLMSSPNSN